MVTRFYASDTQGHLVAIGWAQRLPATQTISPSHLLHHPDTAFTAEHPRPSPDKLRYYTPAKRSVPLNLVCRNTQCLARSLERSKSSAID